MQHVSTVYSYYIGSMGYIQALHLLWLMHTSHTTAVLPKPTTMPRTLTGNTKLGLHSEVDPHYRCRTSGKKLCFSH